MGQVVNPIGQWIARKSFFWSRNISFFFNRRLYKEIIFLFQFLDLIFKQFRRYLRRIYRKSFLPLRPSYNLVGPEGARSLVVTYGVFDYFQIFRNMPWRLWKKFARPRKGKSLRIRFLRRQFNQDRFQGNMGEISDRKFRDSFNKILPPSVLRLRHPAFPLWVVPSVGSGRVISARIFSRGGGWRWLYRLDGGHRGWSRVVTPLVFRGEVISRNDWRLHTHRGKEYYRPIFPFLKLIRSYKQKVRIRGEHVQFLVGRYLFRRVISWAEKKERAFQAGERLFDRYPAYLRLLGWWNKNLVVFVVSCINFITMPNSKLVELISKCWWGSVVHLLLGSWVPFLFLTVTPFNFIEDTIKKKSSSRNENFIDRFLRLVSSLTIKTQEWFLNFVNYLLDVSEEESFPTLLVSEFLLPPFQFEEVRINTKLERHIAFQQNDQERVINILYSRYPRKRVGFWNFLRKVMYGLKKSGKGKKRRVQLGSNSILYDTHYGRSALIRYRSGNDILARVSRPPKLRYYKRYWAYRVFIRLRKYLYRLRKVYIKSIYNGLAIEGWRYRSKRHLVASKNKSQYIMDLGFGYQFYLRSFVLKSTILGKIVSRYWSYIFLCFFHGLVDPILRRYGFRRFKLNFRSIEALVSADLIVTHICREIKKGFRVPFVMSQILKGLNILHKASVFAGYKLCFVGKFSRKQMASYEWKSRGLVSPNNFESPLDFCSKQFVARYGLCGVKVWIQHKHRGVQTALFS